ncbi:DUF1684 domain-containing protein [Niabella sp. W65]|nr:DUF1684 domain-containing protein [Niabella sp. W65]MCH7367704.1 DUF1684 domain-containing protein [Niabella sp. W65]ULT43355.1 DUF1684 domain-containing protein [Niabella sp. I65]
MHARLLFFVVLISLGAKAQQSYKDSVRAYIDNYTLNHGVVKGTDKQYLQFFDVDEKARVTARFEPVKNTGWFSMPTSSGRTKMYRQYGKLSFIYEERHKCSMFISRKHYSKTPTCRSPVFTFYRHYYR